MFSILLIGALLLPPEMGYFWALRQAWLCQQFLAAQVSSFPGLRAQSTGSPPCSSLPLLSGAGAENGAGSGGDTWGSRPSQLPFFFPPGAGCCAREVLVPEGPLYRVAGTAVSIPCNVTGYEGPARQDFEWFLYRPEAPEAALGIVSTRDTRFSYAVFGPRVAAGEVQVQRVRDDAAVLHIARLQAQDAGVYECYTPSTDTRYLGSYSGKVELRGTGPWGGAGAERKAESQGREELVGSPLRLCS